MKVVNTASLRQREMDLIIRQLGGKYSLKERLERGGIGSPPFYYKGGMEALDVLQARAADELKVNLEELKDGFLIRVGERTNQYFIASRKVEIATVRLSFVPERIQPEEGSLFGRLRRMGLMWARVFAKDHEYEAAMVIIEIGFENTTRLQLWANGNQLSATTAYFQKVFPHILQ